MIPPTEANDLAANEVEVGCSVAAAGLTFLSG